MGRNWMDAVCNNCLGNEGKNFYFRVLIGDPLICPRCRKLVGVGEVVSGEFSGPSGKKLKEGRQISLSKERK